MLTLLRLSLAVFISIVVFSSNPFASNHKSGLVLAESITPKPRTTFSGSEDVMALASDARCRKAFNDVLRIIQHQNTSKHVSTPREPAFVKGCMMLPTQVQACLIEAYATQHEQECARTLGSIDPALRQKALKLMDI